MVAVVARVEAAGGIGTLEARGMYMSSVVAVGKSKVVYPGCIGGDGGGSRVKASAFPHARYE